jgi:hypothetical protein
VEDLPGHITRQVSLIFPAPLPDEAWAQPVAEVVITGRNGLASVPLLPMSIN